MARTSPSFLAHLSFDERVELVEQFAAEVGCPEPGTPWIVGQPAAELAFIHRALELAKDRGIHGERRLQLLAVLSIPSWVRRWVRTNWSRHPWPKLPSAPLLRSKKAMGLLTLALLDEDAAFIDQILHGVPRAFRTDPSFADGRLWRGTGPKGEPVAMPILWDERIQPAMAPTTLMQNRVALGGWLPPQPGTRQPRGLDSWWTFQVDGPLPVAGADDRTSAEPDPVERRKADLSCLDLGLGVRGTLSYFCRREPPGARGRLGNPWPVSLTVMATRSVPRPAEKTSAKDRPDWPASARFTAPVQPQQVTRPAVPGGVHQGWAIDMAAVVRPGGQPARFHASAPVPLRMEPLEAAAVIGLHWMRAAVDPVGLPVAERGAPAHARDLAWSRAFTRAELTEFEVLWRQVIRRAVEPLAWPRVRRKDGSEVFPRKDPVVSRILDQAVADLTPDVIRELMERAVRHFGAVPARGALYTYLMSNLQREEAFSEAAKMARIARYE
jgi:hypothetical protein